jgi:hypothetical protein
MMIILSAIKTGSTKLPITISRRLIDREREREREEEQLKVQKSEKEREKGDNHSVGCYGD